MFTGKPRKEETRLRVAKVFGGLAKAKMLNAAEMRTCLVDRLEFIDDDVCDIPHIATYMALLVAHAIVDGLVPLSFVNEGFVHLVDAEGVTAAVRAFRYVGEFDQGLVQALPSYSQRTVS